MASIYDLVRGHQTFCAEADQIVMDVAQRMVELNIGAVPVLRNKRLAGIFSERDLMRRVVVEGRDPRHTRVGDVMTTNPYIVSPATDMGDCLLIMKEHGFRHLPICDGERLVGLVSLRDILMHDLQEKDGEVRAMRAYIQSEG
jgi:CBS domain-containing protein